MFLRGHLLQKWLRAIGRVCVWLFAPLTDSNHCLCCFSSAYLGTLEFTLLFDQENNCLHCTIVKAKVRLVCSLDKHVIFLCCITILENGCSTSASVARLSHNLYRGTRSSAHLPETIRWWNVAALTNICTGAPVFHFMIHAVAGC